VHDTKVIAGGVCIPHVRLVSREIMRVTIPSCVNTVQVDGKDYVAVYMATPYGVTNHLHVPVHCRVGVNSKQPNCSAEVAAKEKPPCKTAPKEEAALEADAENKMTWRLIPLPAVRPNYAMAALMQEPTPSPSQKEAIKALNDAVTSIKVLADAQAKVVPAEFTINMQTAEASSLVLREEATRRADRSGLVTNQLRTKVRECWQNVRDKLPGN